MPKVTSQEMQCNAEMNFNTIWQLALKLLLDKLTQIIIHIFKAAVSCYITVICFINHYDWSHCMFGFACQLCQHSVKFSFV